MNRSSQSMVITGALLPPLEILSALEQSLVVNNSGADWQNVFAQLGGVPDALLVGLHVPEMAASQSLASSFGLIEAIQMCRKAGHLPRYAIGFFPQFTSVDQPIEGSVEEAAINAAMGSITRYATAHLLYDQICINLITYKDSPLGHQRAADAARALTSGLLDTVRGQTLTIGDD